jgi:hypothetical protein
MTIVGTPIPPPSKFITSNLEGLWNLFSGGPSWEPFWRWLDLPPTADEIAWTDKGRVPTLIAAGIVFAPLAAPESGMYATYGAANVYLTNPVFWTEFIGGLAPTGVIPLTEGQWAAQAVQWGWDVGKWLRDHL